MTGVLAKEWVDLKEAVGMHETKKAGAQDA